MDGEPFEEDLKVLAHLPGYPEDLRHYSNLIKQAHPRGMSAVRLILSRPASSTSLMAAIYRYVSEGVPIASAIEAADHRCIWRLADLGAYRMQHPSLHHSSGSE